MKLKESTLMLLALSIPVILIGTMLAVIYGGSLFVHPKYNFLYTFDYNDHYQISNNHIVAAGMPPTNSIYPPDTYGLPSQIYLYDTARDTIRIVSLAEAQQYFLNPGPSSPDGYQVGPQDSGNSCDFFFLFCFPDSSQRSIVVQRNSRQRKLDIDPYNSGSFKFLGWIINQ